MIRKIRNFLVKGDEEYFWIFFLMECSEFNLLFDRYCAKATKVTIPLNNGDLRKKKPFLKNLVTLLHLFHKNSLTG
jgi:hypothetical protein